MDGLHRPHARRGRGARRDRRQPHPGRPARDRVLPRSRRAVPARRGRQPAGARRPRRPPPASRAGGPGRGRAPGHGRRPARGGGVGLAGDPPAGPGDRIRAGDLMADLVSTTDPAGRPTEDAEAALPGPPPEVTLPPLGTVGLLRWAWRQLTSMRTALLLLLLLAVAAVPGSVFPQRRINPGQVQQYMDDHPGYAGLLDRLGLFDVYSSVWFSAIYLLLFVSLVGCVLPRTRAHLKALRSAPPRVPRRLERLPGHLRVTADIPPQETLDRLAAALRRRRYRIARHDEVSVSALSVSAECGYLAETGNLVFHLALLGLL